MSIFTPEEADEFATIVARALADPADANIWPTFVELGWLSLPLAPTLGGLGGGVSETAVVQRAIGRALVRAPYLSTAGMGLGLISDHATSGDHGALVSEILTGKLTLAVDCGTEGGVATARMVDDVIVVSGSFDYVAPIEPGTLLMIRIAGEQGDGVALIPLDQASVSIRPYALVDGTAAAQVELHDARMAIHLQGPDLSEAWDRARARGLVLACAEAVGAMDGVFEATLDYAKIRRQFGSTIGSFQVIQHRLVDMDVARRRAASLVTAAAEALDARRSDAMRLASACKVAVGRSARLAGEQAIQIHGGMGLTSEGAAARYHLRILRLGDMFGNADRHIDALGPFEPDRPLELAF